MTKLSIKVNPKRKVRHPETGKEMKPGETFEVEDSIHWRRRIQSGDAVLVDGKVKGKAAKASENDEKTGGEENAPKAGADGGKDKAGGGAKADDGKGEDAKAGAGDGKRSGKK